MFEETCRPRYWHWRWPFASRSRRPRRRRPRCSRARSIDAEGKPVVGAQIVIEFAGRRHPEVRGQDRPARRVHPDRPSAGHVQGHRHRRQARHVVADARASALSKPAEVELQLRQGAGGGRSGGGREGRGAEEVFEEGVAASQAKNYDRRSRSSRGRYGCAKLLRLLLQHRLRLLAEEGREAGRGRLAEGGRAEGRLHRSAERPGDALQQPEAVRRGGGDGRQGGGGWRRRRAAAPMRSTTRASSSGTRARFPRRRSSSRKR